MLQVRAGTGAGLGGATTRLRFSELHEEGAAWCPRVTGLGTESREQQRDLLAEATGGLSECLPS